MNEFIEKLIGRLEENHRPIVTNDEDLEWNRAMYLCTEIVNQLAEEYNNDFCEWTYDEFEEKRQTDCEVLFALNDSDIEITHYCPYCGKKIKVEPYQPKGE